MADKQEVAIFTPGDPGSRSADGKMTTPSDAKLKKELNAYAVMGYVAVSDRNAMAEQLRGLSHLTQAVSELKEKLGETESKAESLQMEVWRNEAFVTRSRIQLRVKDAEIAGLRKKLEMAGKVDDEGGETSGSRESSKKVEEESTDGGIENQGERKEDDANPGDEMETKSRTSQNEKPEYPMSRGLQIGISREIHEAVVQENIHLKSHLKKVLEDQGLSLKDLIDTIQYKEIIKQIKRRLDEKDREMAKIKDTLQQAESPKEQTAKTLLEMEGKVKNSERTIKMKQVMIEALSSRCEELTKALEKVQQRDEIQMAHMRSVFSGSSPAASSDTSVDEVLPSVLIKNLTKENARLMKLNKIQEAEGDSLRKERDAAGAEKTELKRQLATFTQMKFQPCTTCKELKSAKERAEDELKISKGELEAAFFQVDTYKTDFRERCVEMEKTKSSLRSELETWKRNYNTLNKQMEVIRTELDKQMRNNSKLQADNQYYVQAFKQKLGNPYEVNFPTSMPAMNAQQRCGEKVNPWQESSDHASRPSEIAVGRGRDRPDSSATQEDELSPESHQWTTARPSSSSRRRQAKLECMHCSRKFSPERRREYEDHETRCRENL